MPYLYAVQLPIPNYPLHPIKIGFSVNPERRMKEYTQLPYPVYLIAQWEVEGISAESEVHREFAKFRLNGEWFEPHESLLAYLQEVSHIERRPLQKRTCVPREEPKRPPANLPNPFDLPHQTRVAEWMSVVRTLWPNADRPDWNLDMQCAFDADVAKLLNLSVEQVRENLACIHIGGKNPYRYTLRHVQEYLEDNPSHLFQWA